VRRYVGVIAVALGLLVLGTDTSAALRKPKTHTVVIAGTSFQPASLTVAAGDTVEWLNKDFFPHTATSTQGTFDSKAIETGKSWKYVTRTQGEFPYICTLHTTMKGMLRVK
jgi:plastocyanin